LPRDNVSQSALKSAPSASVRWQTDGKRRSDLWMVQTSSPEFERSAILLLKLAQNVFGYGKARTRWGPFHTNDLDLGGAPPAPPLPALASQRLDCHVLGHAKDVGVEFDRRTREDLPRRCGSIDSPSNGGDHVVEVVDTVVNRPELSKKASSNPWFKPVNALLKTLPLGACRAGTLGYRLSLHHSALLADAKTRTMALVALGKKLLNWANPPDVTVTMPSPVKEHSLFTVVGRQDSLNERFLCPTPELDGRFLSYVARSCAAPLWSNLHGRTQSGESLRAFQEGVDEAVTQAH
jgi:hypothetical protein